MLHHIRRIRGHRRGRRSFPRSLLLGATVGRNQKNEDLHREPLRSIRWSHRNHIEYNSIWNSPCILYGILYCAYISVWLTSDLNPPRLGHQFVRFSNGFTFSSVRMEDVQSKRRFGGLAILLDYKRSRPPRSWAVGLPTETIANEEYTITLAVPVSDIMSVFCLAKPYTLFTFSLFRWDIIPR